MADLEDEDDAPSSQWTCFQLAEIISIIDYGCYMTIKRGTAGVTPEKDSFPFFKSEKKWIQLLWYEKSEKWRLAFFNDQPQNTHEDRILTAYDIVEAWLIRDISDVYLDMEPSTSWRIYNQNKVIKLSPFENARHLSSKWSDGIFAAMQLQTKVEQIQNQSYQEDDPSSQFILNDFNKIREKFWEIKLNPFLLEAKRLEDELKNRVVEEGEGDEDEEGEDINPKENYTMNLVLQTASKISNLTKSFAVSTSISTSLGNGKVDLTPCDDDIIDTEMDLEAMETSKSSRINSSYIYPIKRYDPSSDTTAYPDISFIYTPPSNKIFHYINPIATPAHHTVTKLTVNHEFQFIERNLDNCPILFKENELVSGASCRRKKN